LKELLHDLQVFIVFNLVCALSGSSALP